jgi:hypothetical protein
VTNPRELYLHVAATAADLIAAPEVAAAWHEPSALPKMSVQSLAGHLAGQVFVIPQVLAEPVPAEEVIPIHAYYARVTWIGSDLDDAFNTGIRTGGERDAADGPACCARSAVASGHPPRSARCRGLAQVIRIGHRAVNVHGRIVRGRYLGE